MTTAKKTLIMEHISSVPAYAAASAGLRLHAGVMGITWMRGATSFWRTLGDTRVLCIGLDSEDE